MHDEEAKIEIGMLVTQCAMGLRGFGKEPEQIPVMIKMFLMALGEYPILRIKAAFMAYIKTKSEIPTPAEIIGLIEGANNEWKMIFLHLDHMKNGGSITEPAQEQMQKALGKNWRDYV